MKKAIESLLENDMDMSDLYLSQGRHKFIIIIIKMVKKLNTVKAGFINNFNGAEKCSENNNLHHFSIIINVPKHSVAKIEVKKM